MSIAGKIKNMVKLKTWVSRYTYTQKIKSIDSALAGVAQWLSASLQTKGSLV